MVPSGLENRLKQSLSLLEETWKEITSTNQQDSQEVLDWLDKINEISIRN